LGQVKGLSVFCSGKPAANEVIGGGIAPYDVTLTEGNCIAKAEAAATGSTVITIKKNGSSVGTITWSASGTTGVVDFTSGTTLALTGATDRLTFHAPGTADATLADIMILMRE
jgi:hypothetical protein